MVPSSRPPHLLVAIVFYGLMLPLLSGCGDEGPPRFAVWGTVTWKGQPVPRGVIYFSPDTNKGNSGPQGFALIEDGAFDTRHPRAKGCVLGPHIAMVQGFSGENISNSRPYGDPLFTSYETSLDVSAEGGAIELVVPDTVKAAPPSANEPE